MTTFRDIMLVNTDGIDSQEHRECVTVPLHRLRLGRIWIEYGGVRSPGLS